MAKTTKRSTLFAKIEGKVKKAFDEHRADETTLDSNTNLPPGINLGIAQLVDCKFDTFKTGKSTGELFFTATGIVKEPKTFNKIPTEGLRTRIGPEPVCDTPGRSRETVDEHISWILNELRKLGIDTKDLDFADLESAVETLREEKPHFRFRTWIGTPTDQFPDPKVNHTWCGACEYEEDAPADDVVDETGEEDEPAEADEKEEEEEEALDGEAADNGDVDAQKVIEKAAKAAGIDPEGFATWEEVVEAINGPAEEEEDKDDSDISIDDLGILADENDDEDAMEKLTEAAAEAGLDPDDFETWHDLAKKLVKIKTDEEKVEDPEMEDPEVGDVFSYKPPKLKKPIDVEVKSVNAKRKIVSLKGLDDEKIYANVPWSELISE